MSQENNPGFTTLSETEESQIWASGPDNQHKRFLMKADIDSAVVDSGNTPTTTLRAGLVMGLRDSDGQARVYDADATNGDQKVVGILPKHLSMLRDGTAVDKFTKLLTQGILKNFTDLIGEDLSVAAVLLRTGFTFAQLEPHGSAFLLHPKTRYFKAADYTLLAGDHGNQLVAVTGAVNFTLPDLATVGKGYEVWLYNAVAATMTVTGAANTIVTGDAGGALSTTIAFSTANRQMGGSVIAYADYISDGGALGWYVIVSGTPTYA